MTTALTTVKSDRQEATEFLAALFGRYFQDNDGYVELRFISDHAFSKYLPKGEITEKDWAEIIELNKTHHIYFGVNPRPLDKAKKQDDIEDIVCLWADVDGKDFAGGKDEALNRVKGFPIAPTIVVDSGHGYHLYWALDGPIIGITKEQRTEFKQTLAGLVDRLGADSSKLHLDSCLRLPGTMNIKDPDRPVRCHVVDLKRENYSGDQFQGFRNVEYQEPIGFGEPLPDFGTKTVEVRPQCADEVKRDIEDLMIPSRIKNLIFTGALARGKGTYPSRSERDMAIICSLVYWNYTYATIRSIFYNPLLGCSNRLGNLAERELQWDVRKALEFVKKWEIEESPEAARVSAIKRAKGSSAEEKRKQMLDFITADLLTSHNPLGQGFKDASQDQYYFFDDETKTLMNLESTDFYTFIRYRYRVPERDFNEIKAEIATVIRWPLCTIVTPRRVSHWDKERFILYVSNNANGIYRLDGQNIELCDNGTDGVFFEYDPALTPWTFNAEQEVVHYFEAAVAKRQFKNMTFPGGIKLGLNLERFYQPDCLLNRFLVERARFSTEKNNPLTPWYQRLMLIVYFYSMFFESRLREKPVACFVGLKESGKSFIATSIGKIFDGDSFEASGLPKSPDDLAVVMSRRRYLVLDNLDSRVGGDMMNLICSAATGVAWKKRELYEDNKEISFTPHCFLAITSREPKFTRDDLVSRLLLFSTQKIDHPISRSDLMDPMLAAQSAIMTEVLGNLTTVINILVLEEARKREPGYQPLPCISRLADWETLGRALCGHGPALLQFIYALELMNEKKDEFAIENADVYQVLNKIVIERQEKLGPSPASALYARLVDEAQVMKLKDFQRHCKSPVSMGKWLANNRGELERQFKIDIFAYPNGQREYTIEARDDDDSGPIVLSKARMLEIARTADVEDLNRMLDEAVWAGEVRSWRPLENGDYHIVVTATRGQEPGDERGSYEDDDPDGY